jgi:hypothetical protein
MKFANLKWVFLLSTIVLSGCATSSKIGLLSDGNLEGKSFSNVNRGEIVSGESCGHTHSLSQAFKNSIKGTEYDTVIDAEVESTTAVFVFGNCLKVTGYGVDSRKL